MSGKGIDLRIQRDGQTICSGITEKSFKVNAAPIEITSDDDGGWRAFLQETGVRFVELDFEGLVKDDILKNIVKENSRFLKNVSLVWDNGDQLRGDFYLAGLAETGEEKDAIKFTCALQSVRVSYVQNQTDRTAITAGLYPVQSFIDNLSASAEVLNGVLRDGLIDHEIYDTDTLTAAAVAENGVLRDGLIEYELYDVDSLTAAAVAENGILRAGLIQHTVYDVDQLSAGAVVNNGLLFVSLVPHTVYDIDSLTATAVVNNGTLA